MISFKNAQNELNKLETAAARLQERIDTRTFDQLYLSLKMEWRKEEEEEMKKKQQLEFEMAFLGEVEEETILLKEENQITPLTEEDVIEEEIILLKEEDRKEAFTPLELEWFKGKKPSPTLVNATYVARCRFYVPQITLAHRCGWSW